MVDIDSIIQRINDTVNTTRPWLWQIALTKDEWESLRDYIELYPYENPLATMAWVGRWYRDNYCQGSTEWPLPNVDAKRLWELSGLDIKRFVYLTDTGLHAWQQSAYVLGGLPLRVVSGSRDGKIRKVLCAALAGETEMLDSFAMTGDASSAIRGSIAARHSLYWYMLDVVNGRREGDDPTERQFIALMLDANREALKEKFQLEWLIDNNLGVQIMKRKLKVVFRPERNLDEAGETDTHHRYLHPLRLAALGINAQSIISMFLRYLRNGEVIAEDTKPFGIWRFVSEEQGFLSWGAENYAIIDEIPTADFDAVEIIALCDDAEVKSCVQIFPNQDCIQIFYNNRPSSWTSMRLPQRKSAVIYSDRWHPVDEKPAFCKPFSSSNGEKSQLWNWIWLSTSLCFQNQKGDTLTFRNLANREQPVTKLWPELIEYSEGGLVSVQILDIDEDDEEYIKEALSLPVIFHKSDIGVLTEDIVGNSIVERLPKRIEWSVKRGQYKDWADAIPPYGPIRLRITSASGRSFTTDTLYLPSLDREPLIRDLDNHEIWYGKDEVFVDSLTDMSEKDSLKPSIGVLYSDSGWRCALPVWRPVRRREVLIDGKLSLLPEGDLMLPYIYREHVVLREWNELGFRTFDCKLLQNPESIFGVKGGALKNEWVNGASPVPERGFPWLKIVLGQKKPLDTDDDLTFMSWSCLCDESPVHINIGDTEWVNPGLKFQVGKPIDKELRYRFAIYRPDPRHGLKWASALDNFFVATKHHAYFFIFPTLAQIKEDEVWTTLTRHLDLSDSETLNALHRYADEMGFDYYKITTPLK